jgi:YD repeat-containing protein
MPTYTVNNGAFTPSTSQDNYTLDPQTAGVFAKVVAVGWGGRLTTSTGYRTRWTRPTTAGSSTFTALTLAYGNLAYNSMGSRAGTFATAPTLATDPSGNLWGQDWNAQGGVGMIVFPLANPWWFAYVASGGYGQISCRNIAGTDANGSTYSATVEE